MRQSKAFRDQMLPDFLAHLAVFFGGGAQSTIELYVVGFHGGDTRERKWRGSLVGLGESSEGEVSLTVSERGRLCSWQQPDYQPTPV